MRKPPSDLLEVVTSERRFKLTDLGTAERLADKFGAQLRYVRAWKAWLFWDDKRWCRDQTGVIMAVAKNIVRGLYDEAAQLAKAAADGDEDAGTRASELVAWARRCETAGKLRDIAQLAETEHPIAAPPSQFDGDNFALNVENGTLDLRTGALRPHRQEDMITLLAPVVYDPTALAPTWDRFVAWALPDPEVRDWLQRFLGYAMTGSVSEQILAFLHGGGDNGKSTLLTTVQSILGDYAFQGPPGLLIAPDHRGGDELGRRQRASLLGKRLVVVQETEAGRSLNEAQVKAITGGDRITAARLYENETEFVPTHTIVIAANHRPVVRGADHAIWRRIKLVPFLQKISDADKDPGLPAKLLAEAPGILAWLVRGCLAWQRDGLKAPAAIAEATAAYRASEDRLGEFVETETQPGEHVATSDLHGRYRSWCAMRGETAWSLKAFGDALEERGYKRCRATVGGKTARVIVGLRLRTMGAVVS